MSGNRVTRQRIRKSTACAIGIVLAMLAGSTQAQQARSRSHRPPARFRDRCLAQR